MVSDDSKGKGLYDRDDQGNYWWELRPCVYLDEFEKEKILYIDIMTDNEKEGYPFPCFSYAKDGVFTLNTSYFMIGDPNKLKYVLGVLNSKVGKFIVKNYVTPLQKRQYRMFQQFVETFPVPNFENSKANQIIKIVNQIIDEKSQGINTLNLEAQLNEHSCRLYNFNEEETELILNQE
jgi:adenine-specific DNA-methyltransferase